MDREACWDTVHVVSELDMTEATQHALVAQMVKKMPAMWETWVRSLGWEDPLEKGMATYSGILGWEIPWTEDPGRLPSMGSQRVRYNLATKQ